MKQLGIYRHRDWAILVFMFKEGVAHATPISQTAKRVLDQQFEIPELTLQLFDYDIRQT